VGKLLVAYGERTLAGKKSADYILKRINEKEIVKLGCDLVNIASPTGHEAQLAEFIHEWFKDNEIPAIKQEFAPNRMNAVGFLKGTGGGLSLTFNGHMDTVFSFVAEERMIAGVTAPEEKLKAVLKQDRIEGPGIVNDKGPVAAFMTAAKAIRNSGIELSGDLILAAVAGEIERAPVGIYQGHPYIGNGIGTYHLLSQGMLSDYVIVAEPSGFGVTWALPGRMYLEISTHGKCAYGPYLEDRSTMVESPNAIVKMAKLIEIIEEWAAEYEEKNKYKFSGGVIVPRVNIGAISGGLPFKPNYSAARCSIYVDVHLPPGFEPLAVKRELEHLVASSGLAADITSYRCQKGYQGKEPAVLMKAIREAYRTVLGKRPNRILPRYTSTWNDLNIYLEKGIPGIKFGPPYREATNGEEKTGPGRRESLKISDLINMAKMYALAALGICQQEKEM
jgi:acetylornithine deacetylase/succinyl-diaminopimelate desuccinylase-like protein